MGKYDHLIVWTRPQRPTWMDEETYAQIPETRELREIRYHIVEPGRRTQTIDIITTLVDPDEYTQKDIAEPYGFRWNSELDIRSIKSSLNLGHVLGSHGLLGKQSVFEHSMRTPLIMAGPGIPSGKSTTAFTYLLDLFPTLCDVLSLKPPADLEGESLRPLWDGKKARVRDSVFLPFLQIQRAVRDERWKLIAYPKISHLQLFDLRGDPQLCRECSRGQCGPK